MFYVPALPIVFTLFLLLQNTLLAQARHELRTKRRLKQLVVCLAEPFFDFLLPTECLHHVVTRECLFDLGVEDAVDAERQEYRAWWSVLNDPVLTRLVETAYQQNLTLRAVPGNRDELEPLHQAGVAGFKCFLIDSGVPEFAPLEAADLRSVLGSLAALDALLVVHAVHGIESITERVWKYAEESALLGHLFRRAATGRYFPNLPLTAAV